MAASLTLIKVSGHAEETADGDRRHTHDVDVDERDAFAGNAAIDLALDAAPAEPDAKIDIDALLSRPDVWRGRATAQHATLPTGQSALDALLPGGGWPLGALTEICCAAAGLGELSLLMPALSRMARAQRWVAFVDPPMPLYGPGLVQAGLSLRRVLMVEGGHARPSAKRAGTAQHNGAWAAEQMLRGGACGAAVLWLPQQDDDRPLRRLQLAAEASQGFGVVLRPLGAANRTSPAAVRLRIDERRRIRVFKCRGLNVSPGSARIVPLDEFVDPPSTGVIPADAGIQRPTPRSNRPN